MSLNWDLSKINGGDFKAVTQIESPYDDPNEGIKKGDMIRNPVTTAIIWATMAVGLGEITEKNFEEFYRRLHLWEHSVQSFLSWGQDKDYANRYITYDEVKAHIGLRTNVSKESDSVFFKKLMGAVKVPGQ